MENNSNNYPQAGQPRQQAPSQWKQPNYQSRNSNNGQQFQSKAGEMNHMNNNNQRQKNTKKSFQVLYTHQKTKKKKTWKDGKLVLQHNTRGSLYDASGNVGLVSPTVLDTLELSYSQSQAVANGALNELESEKYLIQVEGPWTNNGDASQINKAPVNNYRSKPGMQKLLKSKFRVPTKIVPLPPEERRKRQQMNQQQQQNGGFRKRRRPLQPGELERQHYGDSYNNGGGGNYYDERNQQNGWNNNNNNNHGGNNYGGGRDRYGDHSMQGVSRYNNNYDDGVTRREDDQQPQSNDYRGQPQQHHNNDLNQRMNNDQPYGHIQNNFTHDSTNVNNRYHNQRSTQYNNNHGINQPTQQSRNDFRGNNNNSQYASNRGNKASGRNSFRSNNNRSRFKSNGYDPNGFYAEEEDEDEQQNGSFENERLENDNVGDVAEQSGNYVGNESSNEQYSIRNDQNLSHHHQPSSHGIQNNDEESSQNQSTRNDATNSSTARDDHDEQVTNHLLALLGAAPSTTSKETTSTSNNAEHLASNVQEERHESSDNHVNPGNAENSFLASIRQAGADEDQEQQDDGPVGFDWNANSDFDDDDDEDEDDTFGQGGVGESNNSSFLNDIVGIGKPQPNNDTSPATNEPIVGFSLPSAGESSSSDDSDGE